MRVVDGQSVDECVHMIPSLALLTRTGSCGDAFVPGQALIATSTSFDVAGGQLRYLASCWLPMLVPYLHQCRPGMVMDHQQQ